MALPHALPELGEGHQRLLDGVGLALVASADHPPAGARHGLKAHLPGVIAQHLGLGAQRRPVGLAVAVQLRIALGVLEAIDGLFGSRLEGFTLAGVGLAPPVVCSPVYAHDLGEQRDVAAVTVLFEEALFWA